MCRESDGLIGVEHTDEMCLDLIEVLPPRYQQITGVMNGEGGGVSSVRGIPPRGALPL